MDRPGVPPIAPGAGSPPLPALVLALGATLLRRLVPLRRLR